MRHLVFTVEQPVAGVGGHDLFGSDPRPCPVCSAAWLPGDGAPSPRPGAAPSRALTRGFGALGDRVELRAHGAGGDWGHRCYAVRNLDRIDG